MGKVGTYLLGEEVWGRGDIDVAAALPDATFSFLVVPVFSALVHTDACPEEGLN